MRYFSPSYWLKLWVLSAPLFNSKNEGIYAKSIANQSIKDWASNNTDLEWENKIKNLSNNQPIPFQNNENIPSSKNLETDDFYEKFLKTQGWSNNPEIAQQQLIEIQEEHHSFLKQEHRKRREENVNKNANYIGTTTQRANLNDLRLRNPNLIRELPRGYAIDHNIRNLFLSWNNNWQDNQFAYYDIWDLSDNPENNGNFIINILNNSPQYRYLINNWEENYGFRLIATYILGRVIHHESQPLNGDILTIGELFPYNVYNNYRNNFLTDNNNNIERWRNSEYLLTFDRYLIDNINRHNDGITYQDIFRNPTFAFRYLNNILNEGYLSNDNTVFRLNFRYHSELFYLPRSIDYDMSENELNDRHSVVLNTYTRTYNQLLSRDFHDLIVSSLSLMQPFVFYTSMSFFPTSLVRAMLVPNSRLIFSNYFLIRATNRIYSEILERNHYQIYDPINSITYHIDGNHLMDIMSSQDSWTNNFRFSFGYDAGIHNSENSNTIDETLIQLRNFRRNEIFLMRWAEYISNWIDRNDNSDLECDNFESFIRSWNERTTRSINNNTSTCIINQDAWYWKLRNEKIYNVLKWNPNNQKNIRKIREKFISTDKGFYFVNLNNEIIKIGDFKNIINTISDNQGSVYITDEFEKRYHINLYDFKYTDISSNILIDEDSYKNVISKLSSFKDFNNKLPIITSLHQVQEDEYNDETSWQNNDIFVGTDQGIYIYS